MKKPILIIIGAVALGALSYAVSYYYQNLRGAWPTVKPPPGDIVDIIEDELAPGKNTTGFPLALSPGFSISIFAKELTAPRVMIWGAAGEMLVSIPKEGRVAALSDTNSDGVAETVHTVVSGLRNPHGLAIRCVPGTASGAAEKSCKLYVAEEHQVAVYDYEFYPPVASSKKKIVDLPSNMGHYTRTIIFLPPPDEDILLVSVGSSCNVCREQDPRRATILSVDIRNGAVKTFAKGLRNAVFMAIHPVMGKVWATEMGRDEIGDDIPPDEINIIGSPSQNSGQNSVPNFGWPICYGKNIHDTNFDKNTYIRNPCMEPFETPSYIDVQAHSAPLGLAFVPEEGWPESWWYDLIVAHHGSWNRSEPTGYKLVRYRMDAQGNVEGTEDFITGWLTKDGALGRPVDVLIQPGGVMYVSDDKAGVIYRITYRHI